MQPVANLTVTTGIRTRYDRIYNAAPVQPVAVGLQYRYRFLNDAVTWIAPLHSGAPQIIDTKYGRFDVRPFFSCF
ncbi:hypothetical protein L0128_08360 [candidate division KSB1 bacterium]|nr:hypothetical protein [candidate division KSB1 bacterium]